METVTRLAAPSYKYNWGVCNVGNEVVEEKREGQVVKEYTVGNARVRVRDDCYYSKTPEEVDAILNRIASKAQKQLSTQD